jgi:hypothetical protein
MEAKTLHIQPSFYSKSPYAKGIIHDLEDDSYGLVFNEFLHEIGSTLEVDVIFEQINQTQWLIADNRHMQIVLNKSDNNEVIGFSPKTIEGELLLSKLSDQLLKENREYIEYH